MKKMLSMFAVSLCSLALFVPSAWADAVAEVNGVELTSLAEALSELKSSGGTLKLLADVESNSFYTDWSTSGMIDLNGHSIIVKTQKTTSGDSGYAWITYTGSGEFTIKNGTITVENSHWDESTDYQYVVGIVEITGTGTLNVEDVVSGRDTRYGTIQVGGGLANIRRCTFAETSRKYSAVSVWASSATAVVEDCTITVTNLKDSSNPYASAPVRASGKGKLIVRGGTYTVPSGGYVATAQSSGGTVEIEGGTFNGGRFYLDGRQNKPGLMKISGGTFNFDSGSVGFGFQNTMYNEYQLNGGTYSVSPSGKTKVTVASYCAVTGTGPYKVQVNDSYEAIIGSTPYTDIDTAIDALAAGQTMKVTKNCTSDAFHTLSVNATIDLDGKTVTVEKSGGNGTPWIVTTGTLMLKNGSVAVYNEDVYNNSSWCVGIVRADGGTLTVEDIVCTKDTRYPAVEAKAGSRVYVRRCAFTEGNRYYCGVAAAGGIVDVEDTSITVSRCKSDDVSAPLRINSCGSLTVKGGTYTASSGKYAISIATSGGSIAVQKGTFSGKIAMDADGSPSTEIGTCSISGGTFTQTAFDILHSRSAYNTYTITGGTFDANPTSYVPATGYVVDDSVAGQWTVRPKGAEDAVAKVTVNSVDSYFDTLDEAFAAVSTAGSTVTVLKDCTMTAKFAPSVSCTVDFGGKTVTGSMVETAFESGDGVTLTLQNGTFASSTCTKFVLATDGKISISQMVADGSIASVDGDVAIDSGTYYGSDIGVLGLGQIVLTGGTYYATVDDPTVFVPTGYEVEDNLDCWTVVRNMPASAVAKIVRGDQKLYFDTLAAAYAAVQGGDTIVVVKDCSMSAQFHPTVSCTLDLNGQTLSCAFPGSASSSGDMPYAFLVDTSGVTFTLMYGTVTCSGTCRGVGNPNAAGAKIVANDVTCIANDYDQRHCQSFYISAGRLEATNCLMNEPNRRQSGIAVDDGGTALIANCTIVVSQKLNASLTTANYYKSAAVYASYGASATITGGTYSSVTYSLDILTSGGAFTISDGTFVGTVISEYNASTYGYKTGGAVTISGGDFTQSSLSMRDQYSACTVTGGTFQVNPTTYAHTTIPAASGKVAYLQGGVWVVGNKPQKKGPVLIYR